MDVAGFPRALIMSITMNYSDKRLIIILVATWIAIVVSGFWWFQFKDIRAFASEKSVVFFEGDKFNQQLVSMVKTIRATKNKTTLVHFWDSECSCNRFNEPHVKELIDKYAQQDIQFVIVTRAVELARKKQVLEKAKIVFNHPAVISVISEDDINLDSMPSTPSVAVINGKQSLMYFGPYSVGAVCNVKNGAFVEKILESMFKGIPKKQLNVLATGCFCA